MASEAATAAPGLDPVDSVSFRRVVGHFATGVTVITTRAGDNTFGMTVSSVTSLSVDPPLMLVCLNNAVPTMKAVAESGMYGINILRQGSAEVAHQFAAPSADKFRGIPLDQGKLGIPLLADALAHLECRVIEQISGGTHTIFVGQVVGAEAREGDPLAYFRGGFGRLEFDRDDQVYLRARGRVLSRRYPADTAVSLDDLAYELDVEKASAFYALTRLAVDGLVRRDPRRGYVVVPFDVRNSDEAFDARTAIEVGVLEAVGQSLNDGQLAVLRSRFEAMAALLVDDRFVSFDRYLDANYAFHGYIVGLTGNRALSAAFEVLSLRAVMARSFGATPVTSQGFVEVQRELTEAMERRDTEGSKRAIAAYGDLAKLRVHEILAETGGQL